MAQATLKSVQLSLLTAGLLAAISGTALAVDGVVLIDQNKALAGNITPGDAPGFPITITQSGSYRLASNLTIADANTTAIEVDVGNVTIDLNGFAIVGPTRCSFSHVCAPTGTGIGIDARFANNVTVVNGTIRGMGSSAIMPILGGVEGASLTNYFEKLRLETNGSGGIGGDPRLGEIANGNLQVRDSVISNNGGNGIGARGRCLITNNVITDNGGDGIFGGECTVTGNTLDFNRGFGLNGFSCGYGNNLFSNNNGGNAAPQVSARNIQLGANVCNGALCP